MKEQIDLNTKNTEINQPYINDEDGSFAFVYNRCQRLATAVFMVSNLMDENEELKTKIKRLSLDLVSISTNLKDSDLLNVSNSIRDIEKKSLELASLLDIAGISGFISKMNASILKSEFQVFIREVSNFSQKFQNGRNVSVKDLLSQNVSETYSRDLVGGRELSVQKINDPVYVSSNPETSKNIAKNGNGQKRKSLRKSTIFDFIKGHNNVSIKDIVPHTVGCSEKTIQRELLELIEEGKIKKIGERRWSRYTTI